MSENGKIGQTFWERIMSLFPYLPQLSIILVVGLVIFGIGWMLRQDNALAEEVGKNSSNTARGLITILVAMVTVAIAVILTLSVALSNATDYKERFALGKEILTILIGVLGTIIGFYFGSAPIDNNKIVNPAVVTSNQNPINKAALAGEAEKKGFDATIAQDFDIALKSFEEGYKTWETYHNLDEINKLFQKNKDKFKAGDNAQQKLIWSEILCEITTKYPWKMTVETNKKLEQLIQKKDYKCTKSE